LSTVIASGRLMPLVPNVLVQATRRRTTKVGTGGSRGAEPAAHRMEREGGRARKQ
jgi:hypothetical protein